MHVHKYTQDANLTTIKKNFRRISLLWHPDRNKAPEAKQIFQQIGKAYQVLSDEEQRGLYDTCLGNQTFYVEKYGHFYLQQYYPKSNTLAVILFLLLVFSIMGPVIQNGKYQHAVTYLTTAAVKNWGLHEGGSKETLEIRRLALEKVKAMRNGGGGAGAPEAAGGADNTTTTTTSSSSSGKSGKKKNKGGGNNDNGSSNNNGSSSKTKLEEDPVFLAAVQEIVAGIDIQGGNRKWEWNDVLAVKLVYLPINLAKWIHFQARWYYLHTVQKLPLSPEEEEYLASKCVGTTRWGMLEESEKAELLGARIWEDEQWSFHEWLEEKEVAKMNPKARKNYLRMKKRHANDGPGDLVADD